MAPSQEADELSDYSDSEFEAAIVNDAMEEVESLPQASSDSESYAGDSDVAAFLDTIISSSAPTAMKNKRPVFASYVVPPRPIVQPPAKWAWHGVLELQTLHGTIETISQQATITDASRADPPLASLGTFLWRKQLLFRSLYEEADVLHLLRWGFQQQYQFAKLTVPVEDSKGFETMGGFLRKTNQVPIIPAAWDDSPEPLGCIAFIPPTSFRLLNAFRVPPYFWRPDGLVVVLMWNFQFPDRKPTRGPPSRQLRIEPFLSSEDWRTTIFIDRPFHRALRILQLPEHIRKLALENACVSWFHGKRSIPDDIEVGINRATHLHAILDRSEVGEVEAMDESARVVFIHVWDLQNIHRMPLLAERRRRRSSETRFCLYGMHHRIHPHWYQAREIYPRGGIVTFTPAALLYDLPGVLKIICNIAASEYWTCYLVPELVALAVKLDPESGVRVGGPVDDIDPIAEDWQELFDLIVEGDVAFMRTPPPNSSLSMSRKQSSADWIRTHIDLRPLTASSVRESLAAPTSHPLFANESEFNTGGSTRPVDSFLKLARAELHEDICRAQATFAFATDYRRYLVVDVAAEGVVAQWDGVGGIEWMVLRDALDLSWDAE